MMQKQRSPYTGGGFNLQQLKAASFALDKPDEGINSMPFLVQLAQQLPRNQHMASSATPQSQSMQSLSGKATGHERGLRSGTPRSYMHNSANNYPDANYGKQYEEAAGADYLHELPPTQGQRQGHQRQQQSSQFGPLVKLTRKHSETDSESECNDHKSLYEQPQPNRWRSVYEHLKSSLSRQQQQRLDELLSCSKQSTLLNYALLLLQIFCILTSCVLGQLLRLGSILGSLSLRLWGCKFQLKSLLRQILWRMTNLKGHDAVVFLSIFLITPWLFLVCLIGFVLSLLFLAKEWLSEALCMIRLHVLN